MAEIVRKILGKEKALEWWVTRNPMLGNIAPMWMSFTGAERKLRDFIFQAEEDNRI